MTKDVLLQIILFAEENGIHIMRVSFDLGNQTLVKGPELSPTQSSFHNPADETRKVYVFPDAPHLIKLVRDHIINGLHFQLDGEDVTLEKEDFEQILAAGNGELRIIKGKLPRDHLDCKGSTRQQVFLATQLLSQTAKAITFLFGQSKAKKAQTIQTMNDWLDVMNASCMLSTKNWNVDMAFILKSKNMFWTTWRNYFHHQSLAEEQHACYLKMEYYCH